MANQPVAPLIHIVSGPPAAGKTTYAHELAERLGAVLLDSDEVTERLIRAGLMLADLDPDDRDSPAYKTSFRDTVYETLFDLAKSHSTRLPVVIAGPFTREGGDAEWPARMEKRLGVMPEFHFVWCQRDERKARLLARGMARDQPKLADWENYVATCREAAPVYHHRWIDTSSDPISDQPEEERMAGSLSKSTRLRLLHVKETSDISRTRLGPYEIETLITQEDEGAATAYRVRIEPHQKTSVSYHRIAEEFYQILEGKGIAILDGLEHSLKAGDFLRLPPGTTHCFITGEEPLVMLDIHCPGSRPDRDVFFIGKIPEGFKPC